MNTSEYYFLTNIFRGKGGLFDVSQNFQFSAEAQRLCYVMEWEEKNYKKK